MHKESSSPFGTITIETEYRKCFIPVRNAKGVFHCWFLSLKLSQFGKHQTLYGLVEFKDGALYVFEPHEIWFTDNKFADYFQDDTTAEVDEC